MSDLEDRPSLVTRTRRHRGGMFLLVALAGMVGCAPAADVGTGGRPGNAVIVLIDALRADHVGAYGYRRATTPNIDRLAAHGVLFENAYSNATFTIPSVASLFTSTLPAVHRITWNRPREQHMRRLPDEFVLITEVARSHGRHTGLVTFPRWVPPTANYMQGIDEWVEGSRRDEDQAAAARAFISANARHPFFLFVHLVEMHDYFFWDHLEARAQELGVRLGSGLATLEGLTPLASYSRLAGRLSRPGALAGADLAFLADMYDERLRMSDRAVGTIVRHLERLDLGDDTVVVVIADHGEQFLEHGHLVHGGAAFYNELVKIPVIVSNPRLFPTPVRASTPFTLIDLAPTVFDLMGIPPAPEFQGDSLIGRWCDDRVVISQDEHTWKVLDRRWSYIVSPREQREELYDLAVDPGETVNVLADNLAVRNRLRAAAHAQAERNRAHPYRRIAVDELVAPLGRPEGSGPTATGRTSTDRVAGSPGTTVRHATGDAAVPHTPGCVDRSRR